MALWWTTTKELFWPEAKLITIYHIFRTPNQDKYHKEEFYYPSAYPQSLIYSVGLPDLSDLPMEYHMKGDHYIFEIDRKRLKIRLLDYLKLFRSNKLDHPERAYFSYSRVKKILMGFFTSLAHFQGRELVFILRHYKDKEDEFHKYFKDHHTQEFLRWQQAEYHFPFYETLFSLHQLKEIDLGGLDLRYNKLHLKLLQREPSLVNRVLASFIEERINRIEILDTEGEEFIVYVNGNYMNPIHLNAKAKSAKIILNIAQGKDLRLRDYKAAFDYIQSDQRFRLFTKTKIKHHKILDTDEGYIIPAKGITIRIVSENDLA